MLAALLIGAAFVGLNHAAYRGFFQDDELDTLSWAPGQPLREFVVGIIKPVFHTDNFRPVGHLYYTLMGRAFGLDFPPYVTPLFTFHLLNAVLLWWLIRRLGIEQWCAIAGAAFFTLSASAFDVYWKPMYVFDLLCTTFSLACILFYSYRRWVLSFISFWLAYRAKELAVMLPAVLLLYEYWFGARKFTVLIPFFLASLNFGIQGLLRNPNKNNDYTFRFTLRALRYTSTFYAARFLFFPLSGILLVALAFLRDRRVWFGLSATLLVMVPLLFLPGRLFAAYTYLPLTGAAIALAACASRFNPVWAWVALALWLPFDLRELRRQRHATLDLDARAASFVHSIDQFAGANPAITTLVFEDSPFHNWGVTGAWNIAHNQLGLPVFYYRTPQAEKALRTETVAYCTWDPAQHRWLIVRLRHTL